MPHIRTAFPVSASTWVDTDVPSPGSADPVAAEQASRSGWGELDEPDAAPRGPHNAGESMWGLERDHPVMLWLYPIAATVVVLISIGTLRGWWTL